jgi:hypothetical protein
VQAALAHAPHSGASLGPQSAECTRLLLHLLLHLLLQCGLLLLLQRGLLLLLQCSLQDALLLCDLCLQKHP